MGFAGRLLGVAGLLPFVATSLGLWLRDDDRFLQVGVLYGAVILSFMGGVQWGFALHGRDSEGAVGRLLWSVVPSLMAWAAVLAEDPLVATLGLAGGLFLTWLYEQRPLLRRSLPDWYRGLRHLLTAVAVLCMLANGFWVALRW
ncbi:MAG TPA: DUF3429 domain-containing protein [Pseudomonadales bacterium]|nr:DUF3429 domain-containing protein [Pseudomonadales bacterium]